MFGNIVDRLGTAAGARDYGISEWLAGGKKTANTGNRKFNRYYSPFVAEYNKALRSEDKGTGYNYVPDGSDSHTTGDSLTDSSTNNTYGGAYGGAYGGGGGSQYTNTTAARAAEQARIDALSTKENNLLASNQNQYSNVLAGYDRERNINQTDYDDNTLNNSQDLQRNKQASLLAGAQGLRGLMNTLGAYGAAGGSGRQLASQAVNSQVNSETGEAANTYSTNQRGLDTSIERFKEEDEARRRAAQQDLETSNRGVRANIAGERQTALRSLADLWKQAGNQGQAGNLLGEVGQLNHFIAENAAPSIGVNAKTAAYQAPSLDTYKAGLSDRSTNIADGNSMGEAGNSLLANLYRKREEKDR